MANRPGIYCILNTTNGKVYIGSSLDAPKRMYVHRWLLQRGSHHSQQLQRSWDRDGIRSFIFSIIEGCDREQLLEREQLWINYTQSFSDKYGYNICTVAGTREGVPQPQSVIDRMRELHSGKPKSREHREKIGAGNKGKIRSQEARAKVSAAVTLAMKDPERRKKQAEYGAISGASSKGRRYAPEIVEKFKAAAKARWDGVPRKERKKRIYVKKPPDQRKKTGPKPGTPRLDRRALSSEQVVAIRKARSNGESNYSLARRFRISRVCIQNIVNYKTYKTI